MRPTTWLWTRLLLLVDRLTGSRLVEWELYRRQQRIEQLLATMDSVNQELDTLKQELDSSQLVLCLMELKVRSERDTDALEDWLSFAPGIEGDEEVLDAAIEHLVKRDLARIDTRAAEAGGYVYRLYPDWKTIYGRVQDAPVNADLMGWLHAQATGGSDIPA
jgi:hypothetical protein